MKEAQSDTATPKLQDDIEIVPPTRDLLRIVRAEDSAALGEFMKDAPSAIAGALIETLTHGPTAFVGPAVRIGVAALSGRAVRQLAAEVEELRKKAKIVDDYADRKYGFKTLVELPHIIDEEAPDEDRLDAMKAMFFAAYRVGVTEEREILAYQLFQIAKRLNSNELLVLKAIFQNRGSFYTGNIMTYQQWSSQVSQYVGHGIWALVEHADKALVDNRLISDRIMSDRSGVQPQDGRLTDLGIKFCENIEYYEVEKRSLGATRPGK